MSFDWRTEEEVGWEQTSATAVAAFVAPQRRLLYLVVFGLVVLAVLLIRWQIEQQADQVTTTAKVDLLSSHNLIHYADQQQDRELVRTLLADDDAWMDAQEALVRHQVVLDRTTFGLTLIPVAETQLLADVVDEAALGIISVAINSDLSEAEVVYEPTYYLTGQPEQTTRLRQTAVYRKGANRWLLSPMAGDFWGEELRFEGDYVTLIYPERDADIAMRLFHDIDSEIERFCRELAAVCPNDLSAWVRLETDVNSLLMSLIDDRPLLQNGLHRIEIPTPTLVGLPVDEIGYQALKQSYVAQVLSAIMTDLSGYTCCRHELFYRALLDMMLADLQVRTWPVTDANYQQLAKENVSLGQVVEQALAYWNLSFIEAQDTEQWWHVYVLMEFILASDNQLSVPEIQNRLHERVGYNNWMRVLIWQNPRLNEKGLPVESRWSRFVFDRTQSADAVTFPEE